MPDSAAFDLERRYLELGPDGSALAIDPQVLWNELRERTRRPRTQSLFDTSTEKSGESAWLVGIYTMRGAWDLWERHTLGDEMIYVVSGKVEIVMEHDATESRVVLEEGASYVMPRNVWHRGGARSSGATLHITPRHGNEHKPVST